MALFSSRNYGLRQLLGRPLMSHNGLHWPDLGHLVLAPPEAPSCWRAAVI